VVSNFSGGGGGNKNVGGDSKGARGSAGANDFDDTATAIRTRNKAGGGKRRMGDIFYPQTGKGFESNNQRRGSGAAILVFTNAAQFGQALNKVAFGRTDFVTGARFLALNPPSGIGTAFAAATNAFTAGTVRKRSYFVN